ncbi:MAG: MarR family winged helix-turn-helix transcriptional regulator [Faecousia sp.]
MDSKTTLVALRAFSEAYSNACKPICRELGMPQMAFDILMFLSNNPDHCTAKEISQFRGFKENIISVNVNKLVTEGYLLRQSDQADRRKVRLICTEKAASIVRRGRELQERFLCQMQQGLSPEELQVHAHCLETIAANARRLLERRNEV